LIPCTQKEELMEPVEARERALLRLGAVWRPPLLLDVRLTLIPHRPAALHPHPACIALLLQKLGFMGGAQSGLLPTMSSGSSKSSAAFATDWDCVLTALSAVAVARATTFVTHATLSTADPALAALLR
jgi:hypothetical protein